MLSALGQAPDEVLLKDYHPKSIYKIPETRIAKAKFPVIDMHSHDYARTPEEVAKWVRTMDEVGIEKTVILSGATGARFDEIRARYGQHGGRFEVWCGLDLSGFDREGFGAKTIEELVRCKNAGATGVGELSDKGRGMGSTSNNLGIHVDDPRMDPILEKCADLGLPINIHVGEDKWMYEPMDKTNDGLMNAWKWRINKGPGVLEHDEVVDTLERAVKKHPRTIFVACHLANCCSDLGRLGEMLNRYPNLYADIGARYSELAPIPRFVTAFFNRYPERIVYGTDLTPEAEMYRMTFRLLESADEHIYTPYFAKYHWPLHGLALPQETLKKLYQANAAMLLRR